MAYTPVTVEDFVGLRLRPEQGEAQGGAVSMLNVDLSRDQTQIGSRGGLVKLGTGTASYHRLGILDSNSVMAFRNTGASASAIEVANFALATGTVNASGGSWGGPNSRVTATTHIPTKTGGAEQMLVCTRNGTGNDAPQKVMSLASVTPLTSGWGGPRYAVLTPISGRLVLGHFPSSTATPSGSNGSIHTVWFGAPGGATFGANDWVDLDPGDGSDGITGLCAWRELTFAIKRSRLYVFYGESVDSTGGAVFNYRAVDLPERARATTNGGGENIVAGGKAVYLLLADGLYATTGGTPVPVGRTIKPIFDGTGDSSMLFPTSGDWNIGYADGRVYLNYTVGSNQRTLVYDEQLDEWFLWDLSAGQGVLPANIVGWVDANGLPATWVATGAKVCRWSPTAATDDGTAISSSYQYGFLGMGSQAQKRVRQSHLWGSGSPTWSLFTDYGSTDALAAAVTLGATVSTDDFSTDTIANYTFDAGLGTLSVSGGKLVPSTTATKNFYRSGFPGRLTDFQFTLKFTTGATATSYRIDMYKRLDAQNYAGLVFSSGSGVSVQKLDTGTLTALSSLSGVPTLAATTSYWLRVKITGNVFTAEYWTTTPFSGGTPSLTETFTLTGADATKFGQGVVGDVGVRFTPSGGTDWTLDEFVIEPATTTVAEGYDRQARRGRLFSFKVASAGPWVVTRVVLDVAPPRDEALKGR